MRLVKKEDINDKHKQQKKRNGIWVWEFVDIKTELC